MFIAFDIETVPTSRDDIRERVTADVSPPGQYKKPESIAQWWASQGDTEKNEAIAKTALNGTFGEIFCIGFCVDDGPITVISRGADGEELMLRAFGETVVAAVETQFKGHGHDVSWDRRVTWVGHNAEDFDMRFLWQRCVINRVKLPFALPLERYPKGPYLFDTMKQWGGWNGRVKQLDIELAFGLPRVDTITGADVWECYKAGDFGSITKHCEEDVRNLREIYKRMA